MSSLCIKSFQKKIKPTARKNSTMLVKAETCFSLALLGISPCQCPHSEEIRRCIFVFLCNLASIEIISLQTCTEVIVTDGYREKSSDRINFMCIIEKVTAIGRMTAIGYRLAIWCNIYVLERFRNFHFTDRITYWPSVKSIRNLQFHASSAQLYVYVWCTLW